MFAFGGKADMPKDRRIRRDNLKNTRFFRWEVADGTALDALAARLENAGVAVRRETAADVWTIFQKPGGVENRNARPRSLFPKSGHRSARRQCPLCARLGAATRNCRPNSLVLTES